MTIPPVFDLPACTRCASCGEPIELTWTTSCVGHSIWCGGCWENRHN